jgi:hypothetical protein
MPLQSEASRLLNFVISEKTRLLPQIRQLGHERASAEEFLAICEDLFQILQDHLESRVKEFVQIASFQVEVASQALDSLFAGIETTLSFFANVAAAQEEIPREFYHLVSWFFDRCSGVHSLPKYVITTSSELATLDFREFLSSLFISQGRSGPLNSLFPALTNEFSNRPFFFFFIPGYMAPASNSLDWPLIFHECTHAIEDLANIIGPLFPALPRSWESLTRLAEIGDSQAQEALWTHELICDFVPTLAAGPSFVWRFLQGYFSISRVIHQSSTHPPPDVRISRSIEILKRNGFREHATKASLLLRSRLRELPGTPGKVIPLPQFTQASKQYESKVPAFDIRAYTSSLRERYALKQDKLIRDILDMRPVLLDPACLFALVAFDDRCENAKIASLLADYIRLYAIESRYQKLDLKG